MLYNYLVIGAFIWVQLEVKYIVNIRKKARSFIMSGPIRLRQYIGDNTEVMASWQEVLRI